MIWRQRGQRNGLTLIEVALVVAMAAVLFSSASALFTATSTREGIKAKAAEVAALIDQARNNAIAGFQSDTWGIRVLDNDPVNGDCVVLYKGSNYSTRSTSYDRMVQINNGFYLESTQQNDFYFTYNSGWLASTTYANLPEQAIAIKSTSGAMKNVSTTPFGLVYYGD
ncbi:MAG: hypothetical protein C3F02_00205 [Parcubacteria group bacterium]|nr:MAG: hypothetical protein C3F02_00205 [Parcubacteria group bacterium]